MLDLLPLEETQAPVHPVGNGRIEQRVLQHPGLGIGAVQHPDAGQLYPVLLQSLHLVHDVARLVEIGGRLEHPQRLAMALRGPQVLAEPGAVITDQVVRGIQNVAVGAVILLQLDDLATPKSRSKACMLAEWPAEGVDGLVVVSHREYRTVVARQ